MSKTRVARQRRPIDPEEARYVARGDGTTREAKRHLDVGTTLIVDQDASQAVGRAVRTLVERNSVQDTLDWVWRKRLLGWELYHAARRLHRDWLQAGYDPLRAPDLQGHMRGPMAPEALSRIEAQERVKGATTAMGRYQTAIVARIVCAGERLAAVERDLGMPKSAALVALKCALYRLGEHYAEVDGGRMEPPMPHDREVWDRFLIDHYRWAREMLAWAFGPDAVRLRVDDDGFRLRAIARTELRGEAVFTLLDCRRGIGTATWEDGPETRAALGRAIRDVWAREADAAQPA